MGWGKQSTNWQAREGNDYIAKIVVEYKKVTSVEAIAYAVNNKKGSASIRTYRSSPAITITNMLDEINKWDTFKVDLPQDVQMKINGETLPKEHGKYTNLFSKGELNQDQSVRDSDGNTIAPKMVEYLSGSIGDRVNPYDPNSKHMVWF